MPTISTIEGAGELVAVLDEAVRLREPGAITERLKNDLERLLGERRLVLPERFRAPRSDTYARRLLHRDPELDYCAVVMTWAPGQRTPLHDHAGCWCVEGVVEGEMEVVRFEPLEASPAVAGDADAWWRFRRCETLSAGVGEAGALIPPLEHHVLGNPRRDRIAMTLHVYPGEMRRCSIYEPTGDGWWRRREHELAYHA